MTGKKPVTEDTYIRMLPFSVINYLARILDIDRQWERLVGRIPKRLQDVGQLDYETRYSQIQVRIFEDRGKRHDSSTTRSIIDDWGTQNAKVKHLLHVLQDCHLYEAADYISEKVLHGDKVPRGPVRGEESYTGNQPPPTVGDPPKMVVDEPFCAQSNFKQDDGKKAYDVEKLPSDMAEPSAFNGPYPSSDGPLMRNVSYESGGTPSIGVMASPPLNKAGEEQTYQIRNMKEPCETTDVSPTMDEFDQLKSQKMPYYLLERITDNFNKDSHTKGGHVIGTGGFGQVYLGIFPNGMKVAVKSLKNIDEVEKQFETELDSLSKFRHENIVSLLGYSIDGPSKCLVYEYLSNGSLEDRLACKNGTPALTVPLRVSIAQGTAKGIHFLNKNGIVHRDIKSANILLDDDFNPKVGDFATARAGPRGHATAAVNTTLVIGTPAYLAPEAMTFDISTKLDSYSFGVVILELLTGLPAMDQTREEKDLKSHIDEADDLESILDEKAGTWPKSVVAVLESVADQCLVMKKKQRKNVEDILADLFSIKF